MLPLILSMALPAMFSMLVQALYNIVDTYYVSKVSEKAMSAVSLALGGLILWDPFDTGLLLWRIIGGAFLYLGLSDLWSIYTLNRLIRRAQQD